MLIQASAHIIFTKINIIVNLVLVIMILGMYFKEIKDLVSSSLKKWREQ